MWKKIKSQFFPQHFHNNIITKLSFQQKCGKKQKIKFTMLKNFPHFGGKDWEIF